MFLINRSLKSVPWLIVINILVYCAWVYAEQSGNNLDYMVSNFLISGLHLEERRYWTLITSVFSHNMFIHILLNMTVLNSFGPIVESILGSWRFLRFYLMAGIISSAAHVLVSTYLLDNTQLPALGASGAISGILLLFCLIFPKEKILLLGIVPVPALTGALIFMGLDIWGLMAQADGGGLPIGHGAHLGGALTGLLYYFIIRQKLRRTI